MESMGTREKEAGQDGAGDRLEVGWAKGPEEELGKSLAHLGFCLRLSIFLSSADKIQ